MRRKLVRKKDWERLDRALDWKYFVGAIIGAGISMMAAALSFLGKFWTGFVLTFLMGPMVALFWAQIEERAQELADGAKDVASDEG